MKTLTQAANERIDRYYNAIPDFRKKEMYQSDVKTKHSISNGDWFIKKGFAVKVGHYYEFRDGITRDEIKAAMGYAITKESELPLEVTNTIKDATTVESMHSGDLKKSSILRTYWTNLKESDYFLARSFFNVDGILVINLGTTQREIYIERSVNKTGHEEPYNLSKRTLYKFDPIRNTGKIYDRGSKGYWLVPVDCLDIVPIEQPAPVEVIETVPVVNDEVVTATAALSFRGNLAKSLFTSMMNGNNMSGDLEDYSKLVRDSIHIANLLIYYDNKIDQV
jgi:hypothetical protein